MDINPIKFADVFMEKYIVELKTQNNIYISVISNFIVKEKTFIVRDEIGKQILVFDTCGKLKNMIGKSGDGPGEYTSVESIDINDKNEILVLDRANWRVSKFKINGEFIKSLNVSNSSFNILADHNDCFFVYCPISNLKPENRDIILHYNNSGKNDFSFCKPFFETGICEGDLVKDHNNNIYASQGFCYNFVKYSSEGRYITSIDFMANYIKQMDFKKYDGYPPIKAMNECSSVFRLAISSKYIFLVIKESPKNGFSMNIYNLEGNLLKSRIKIPLHLIFLATDDNDLLYFTKEPDDILDMTRYNFKIITYAIKGL